MDGRRVLLAVSGGIAAYKVPELVRGLRKAGHRVRCALTREAAALRRAARAPDASRARPCAPSSSTASRRARSTTSRSPTGRRLVVVAPATANLLAKLAGGPRRRPGQHAAPRDARAGARRARDEREHVAPPGHAGERGAPRRARRALRRARTPASSPAAGRARAAWPSPREIAGRARRSCFGPPDPRRRARARDGRRHARAASTRCARS